MGDGHSNWFLTWPTCRSVSSGGSRVGLPLLINDAESESDSYTQVKHEKNEIDKNK